MKKLIYLLTLVLIISSCDDYSPGTFDGQQTFVYFDDTSVNLDIVIDETGQANVQLNTTTLSNQDRTVSLVLDEENSTADPANYQIPSLDVVIPAGEYFGNFVINGVDNTAETNVELLLFTIESAGEDARITSDILEVSVRQVCPIEDGFFTGPYLLEQLTPIHPENGTESLPTSVVDLVVSGGATERTFESDWISFGNVQTYPMDLSCNDVLVTGIIDTNLLCVQGVPTITLGPAPITGSYDPLDDSTFTYILAEYLTNGSCNVPAPLTTEFQFTKQ